MAFKDELWSVETAASQSSVIPPPYRLTIGDNDEPLSTMPTRPTVANSIVPRVIHRLDRSENTFLLVPRRYYKSFVSVLFCSGCTHRYTLRQPTLAYSFSLSFVHIVSHYRGNYLDIINESNPHCDCNYSWLFLRDSLSFFVSWFLVFFFFFYHDDCFMDKIFIEIACFNFNLHREYHQCSNSTLTVV